MPPNRYLTRLAMNPDEQEQEDALMSVAPLMSESTMPLDVDTAAAALSPEQQAALIDGTSGDITVMPDLTVRSSQKLTSELSRPPGGELENKGSTALGGDAWSRINTSIDNEIAPLTETRGKLLEKISAPPGASNDAVLGNLLGALANFGIGMAAGGGKHGLALGLQGAGDTGTAWAARQDELAKSNQAVTLKQVEGIDRELAALRGEKINTAQQQAGAEAQRENTKLSYDLAGKNQAAADERARKLSEIPADEQQYVLHPEIPVPRDKTLSTATIKARDDAIGKQLRDREISIKSKNADTLERGLGFRANVWKMKQAANMVAGAEPLEGHVPNEKVFQKATDLEVGTNSLLDLADQMRAEIKEKGTSYLGNPGWKQQMLDAAMQKEQAVAKGMGANWTDMERTNITSQLSPVGTIRRIVEGKLRGVDAIKAIDEYKAMVKDLEADYLMGMSMKKIGYKYDPNKITSRGMDPRAFALDSSGIARRTGSFVRELEKTAGDASGTVSSVQSEIESADSKVTDEQVDAFLRSL